jgi:hypothetical protein
MTKVYIRSDRKVGHPISKDSHSVCDRKTPSLPRRHRTMRSYDARCALRVNGVRLNNYLAINQPVSIVGKVIMVGTWNGRRHTEMVLRSSDHLNVLIEDIPVSGSVCDRHL